MKRKLQSLVLMLLAIMMPATAAAYDFEVDGIYYNINGSEATVTNNGGEYWNYGSYSGDVTIPNTVTYDGTTYSVTAIGHTAFFNCTELTSVSIPNSVIIIDNNYNMFVGCSSLASIIVDSGNPKYDSRDNCNAIIETASNTLIAGCMSTVIPNSVTHIGDYALSGCSSLTNVIIPNSVISIGECAFRECRGLTSVTIGNSVASISDWAFVYCSSLTSIIVDSGNPKYDSRNNCNAIIETASNTLIAGCMSTVIPGTVTSIGYGAFVGCSGLTSMTIPNSVTAIGKMAFTSCTSLTNVTISNSVTSIGEGAFSQCTGLTSVDIPNSVTAIGNNAFSWCTSLTNVTIPNSVTSIGNSAFYNCGLTSLDIPNSVTSIGIGAFTYCSNLTSVTIPNSVTYIGDEAFSGCTSLTDVYSYITDLSKVACGDRVFHAFAYGGDDSSFDYSGRTLHVPAESLAAYKADTRWSRYFGSIVKMNLMLGDVNGDDEVSLDDVTKLIDYLLTEDPTGVSLENADINNDGMIDITDVAQLIDYLLKGSWPEEEHEYVDLGLPSGTLWATCNVGASNPEDYGDYFAWGETEPKENYSWENYKWCNGSEFTLTKYCLSGTYGIIDWKRELEPEDDAASVNWGPSWRMPSLEQFQELCEQCYWTWTQRKGVKGRLVTGPNGNSIFLPASGGYSDHLYNAGSFAYYWSHTLCSRSQLIIEAAASGQAYIQFFNISNHEIWYSDRCIGHTVRAVRVSQE